MTPIDLGRVTVGTPNGGQNNPSLGRVGVVSGAAADKGDANRHGVQSKPWFGRDAHEPTLSPQGQGHLTVGSATNECWNVGNSKSSRRLRRKGFALCRRLVQR